MGPSLPWLRQGDVFEDIPWVAGVHEGDVIRAAVGAGAALLITHGCQMDKRTNSGRPKAERLQFLPLHPTENLNPDSRGRLRRLEVNPPEAIFVGELPDGQEAFGLLGEACTLPASFFGVELEWFEDHPEADPTNPYHLVARRHACRLGTLDDAQLQVMHQKMLVFWARSQAQ